MVQFYHSSRRAFQQIFPLHEIVNGTPLKELLLFLEFVVLMNMLFRIEYT